MSPNSIRSAALLLLLALLSACSDNKNQAPATPITAEREIRTVTVDDAAGAELYAACASCHGADGGGNTAMHAPSLVKLDDWYVVRQLKGFRDGLRGTHTGDQYGATMRPMTLNLSDSDIDSLAAYIGKLPKASAVTTVEGDIVQGKDYYSMVCGSCHGPEAEGNTLLGAPALAGTDDWYLLRQFEYFRDGVRGKAEGDKWGYQMVMMSKALPDEQVTRNVIAYIQSLAE